jgi:hypothetical protein
MGEAMISHATPRVLALAAGLLSGLVGCQVLGPSAISQGRDRYNSIIQATWVEQVMSNIVRVYEHEPTAFLDVTEVDALVTFAAQASGGLMNIGADSLRTATSITNGRVGNASGMLQYTESPTIRYQPLLGEALVAQLATPVSVDALGLLYDSNWNPAAMLDLAVGYFTLDGSDFYSALDTIQALDDDGGIELAAGKSALTPEPTQQAQAKGNGMGSPSNAGAQPASAKQAGGNANDALVIYLRPPRPYDMSPNKTSPMGSKQRRILKLWARLLRIYEGSQPESAPVDVEICKGYGLLDKNGKLDRDLLKHWDVKFSDEADKNVTALEYVRKCWPTSVELRVVSIPTTFDDKIALAVRAAAERAKATLEVAGQAAVAAAAAKMPANPADKAKEATVWAEVTKAAADNAAALSKSATDNATNEKAAAKAAAVAMLTSKAPMIRAYSALGILKNATSRPEPKIGLVTPETYRNIRMHHWNQDLDDAGYYILLPDDEDSVDCPPRGGQKVACENPPKEKPPEYEKWMKDLKDWMTSDKENLTRPDEMFIYEKEGDDVLDPEHRTINYRLGELRRYMLIIVSDLPPSNAYVSYFSDRKRRWYYIADEDQVSQRNFHLLTLFLTMMAQASTTPPLSPVINVGP